MENCNCNNNDESCLYWIGFIVVALFLFRIGIGIGMSTIYILFDKSKEKIEKRHNLTEPISTNDSTYTQTNKENKY